VEVLWWILVGAIVGGLARLFLPGRSPLGCLGTIFIGIAGAVIGGKVWEEIFGPQRGVAWIGAILAAMLLTALLAGMAGKRRW
jgi:uncharacterized membrane protein YeaQ/YmgE (transglycosylase-associated protein family)